MNLDKQIDELIQDITCYNFLDMNGESQRFIDEKASKAIKALILKTCEEVIDKKPESYIVNGKVYRHGLGGLMALYQYEIDMRQTLKELTRS
jgi:hypothetical protein